MICYLALNGCSSLHPKKVGYKYKYFEEKIGCDWEIQSPPSIEFELVNSTKYPKLIIYSGRHKSRGTGYQKKRQVYERYEVPFTYPTKYQVKYLREEIIEKEDGECINSRWPGGSDKINVRVATSGMSGSKFPNNNGLVAIDLLEPAILAGNDRELIIHANSRVTYNESGKKREISKNTSNTFTVPISTVNYLISYYKSIKSGEIEASPHEAYLSAKYVYDSYGNIKLSAKFIKQLEEARSESKRKKVPVKRTNAARGLFRLARLNPVGIIAGLFIDAAISSSGDSSTRKLTFVEP